MKVINILFNSGAFSSNKKILGVERCFIDYAKELSKNNWEVLSITTSASQYKEEFQKAGCGKLLEMKVFGKGDLFSIVRLIIIFLFFRPNIVICHSGRALFFARAARFLSFSKSKIVAIDHGINPKKFLKADYVLTVNKFFSSELVRAGKDPKTALVMQNMITIPENFIPLQKKPFRKPLRLGSLGRFAGEKYFDKLIAAMAILRDRGIETEFYLGGAGEQEESLKQFAAQLNLNSQFKIIGWVDDKRKFFDDIDIFVLPSVFETFGIVLLEAMLYSTPIITSNTWGPDEIIDDDLNGLKVSKDDAKTMPALLADAIEKMAKDNEFAKKMAENAYKKLWEVYSSEVVGKKLSDNLKLFVANKS